MVVAITYLPMGLGQAGWVKKLAGLLYGLAQRVGQGRFTLAILRQRGYNGKKRFRRQHVFLISGISLTGCLFFGVPHLFHGLAFAVAVLLWLCFVDAILRITGRV